MDLIELKGKYGDKLSFMGGIDTRLMSDPDKTKIEQEIKTKIEVAKKNGGYIYHSDHSIPNIVSFQDYCLVMKLVKKYGVYEHPEPSVEATVLEEKKEEAPVVEQKKKKFGFGRKKEEKIAQPVGSPEIKSEEKKKGIFGKKEKTTPVEKTKPESKPSEKKSVFGFLKGKKK
jgi:hypothetical protein